MLITLEGVIVQGIRSAAGNLKTQLPEIAKEFPEIRDCRHGTLNLQARTSLVVTNPDYVTKLIKWGDANKPQYEIFHLTRIRLAILGPNGESPKEWAAWIYGPQNSLHLNKPGYFEIITADIQGCPYGTQCRAFVPAVKLGL